MVALCVFGGITQAGEEPNGVCDLCVCVDDATCSSPEIACTVDVGCNSVTFTPTCTGNYTFEFRLVCSNTCDHCLECAYVTSSNGGTVATLQGGCGTGATCRNSMTIGLTGGTEYKLFACLRSCDQGCDGCSGCTAKARVYQTQDDCTGACNW